MAGAKQKSSPKQSRYGKKQRHGGSRAAYFITRSLWRAAKNKARRIEKDAKAKAAAREKEDAGV